MKPVQNEKGYTLLLTLIIIFIIIIFFSSFAFSAMSQQKQVEFTDSNYEVTAISEMGVEYYIDKLFIEKESAQDSIELILNNKNKSISKKREEIKQIQDNFKDMIYNLPNEHPTNIMNEEIYLDSKNTKYFGVSNLLFNKNLLTIRIFGRMETTGTSLKRKKELSVTFNIPDELINESINIDETTNSPTTGFEPLIDSSNLFQAFPKDLPVLTCPKEIGNLKCITNSFTDLKPLNNSSVFLLSGGNIVESNTKNYNNSKLYIKGNLTLGVINGKPSNLSLIAYGKGKFGTINQPDNLFIQTDAEAEFDKINNGEKITLYINGPIKVKELFSSNVRLFSRGANFGKTSLKKNSTVQINGNSIFNTYTLLEDNTKVQVIGNADFTNQLNMNLGSTLQISGSSSFMGGEINNSIIQLIGSTTFSEQVNFYPESKLQINGSANFKGANFSNTNVQINGKASFKQWSGITNSYVYFGDDIDFYGFSIGGSKVCFKSKLDKTSFDKLGSPNNSKIYILDSSIPNSHSENSSLVKQYVSEKVFNEQCPTEFPTTNSGNGDFPPEVGPVVDESFVKEIKYN